MYDNFCKYFPTDNFTVHANESDTVRAGSSNVFPTALSVVDNSEIPRLMNQLFIGRFKDRIGWWFGFESKPADVI